MSSTHGAARNGRVAAITATLALFGAIGGAASEGTNGGFQNDNGLQFSTNATELSPILGDGLMDQAAAVWA
jgi:hypothetical protein